MIDHLLLRWRALRSERERSILILAAHGVHSENGDGFVPPQSSIPLEVLQGVVEKLSAHFQFVRLRDALPLMLGGRETDMRATAVLTFDDSFSCMHDIVTPWLYSKGIPATFFLSTDIITHGGFYWWVRVDYAALHSKRPFVSFTLPNGELTTVSRGEPLRNLRKLKRALFSLAPSERESFVSELEVQFGIRLLDSGYTPAFPLNWEQARAIARCGMELGSHTVTHPNLLLLTRDEVKSELLASKQKIEEESGGKCVSFCYPHGLCSPEIGTLVSNAGYRVAVTTKKPGWNTSATNIFNLNRAYIPRSAKVHRLALGLS